MIINFFVLKLLCRHYSFTFVCSFKSFLGLLKAFDILRQAWNLRHFDPLLLLLFPQCWIQFLALQGSTCNLSLFTPLLVPFCRFTNVTKA